MFRIKDDNLTVANTGKYLIQGEEHIKKAGGTDRSPESEFQTNKRLRG